MNKMMAIIFIFSVLIGVGSIATLAYLKDNSDNNVFETHYKDVIVRTFAGDSEPIEEPSNLIDGNIGRNWRFTIVEDNKSEVYANIFMVNETTIELTLNMINESNLPANYKWSMVLCNIEGVNNLKYQEEDNQGGFNHSSDINVNYGNLIDYGMPETWCDETNNEGFVLFSSGSKNQLPKHLRLVLPDDAVEFKLYAGTGSILIDASSDNDATAFEANENICIMSGIDGHEDLCHIAYIGGGSDLWYGNATYDIVNHNCSDWSVNELLSGTVDFVNINCGPDGTITVSFLNVGDIDMYQSTTDGASFGSITTVEDDVDTFAGPIASAVDSTGVVHWCGIDDDDDTLYVRSDDLDGGTTISSASSDHCDIEVDSSDNVYIAISDDLTDDFAIMSDIDSFGSRNYWNSGEGSSVSETFGLGVSLAICNNGSIYGAYIDNTDLVFCTSSTSSWTTGTCTLIDGDISTDPDMLCSEANYPYIVYDNTDIYLANSTGGAWAYRVSMESDNTPNYPSVADSMQPSSNRMNDKINMLFVDSAGLHYSQNVSILGTRYNLTITNSTTANPYTNVQSGQTLELDFNLSKWGDDGSQSAVTTGVTMENVTVDGTDCKVNSSGSSGSTSTSLTSPTATGDDYNGWVTPENCYTSNNQYGYWYDIGIKLQDYYNFGFSIPSGATIDGIVVEVEAYSGGLEGTGEIELSWDGGTSYTNQNKQNTWTTTETTKSYGGSDDTWGRTWSDTDFSNTNFRLRAEYIASTYWMVDHIQVKVYYTYTTISTQFAYSPDKGVWEVNCSAPVKDDGTYDLFINATYSSNTYNNTQIDAVTYGTGEAACQCPASGNWDMNDCVGTTITDDCDMQTNNVYCTTAGEIILQARITNYGEVRTENNCHIRCENQICI